MLRLSRERTLMLAVDVITLPTIIVAALCFFASLAFTDSRRALLGLFLIGLAFLLYRQHAVYSYGPAYGDYDFGFPFRWVTTQSDAGPCRLRLWALAADFAVAAALWCAFQLVRRYSKPRNAEHGAADEHAPRSRRLLL